MDTITWSGFVELCAALVAVIAAGGGVTALVNRLKTGLGLRGRAAYLLSWLVAAGVGLLMAVVAGEISPALLAGDPLRLLAVIVAVVFASEKAFRFERDRREVGR